MAQYCNIFKIRFQEFFLPGGSPNPLIRGITKWFSRAVAKLHFLLLSFLPFFSSLYPSSSVSSVSFIILFVFPYSFIYIPFFLVVYSYIYILSFIFFYLNFTSILADFLFTAIEKIYTEFYYRTNVHVPFPKYKTI